MVQSNISRITPIGVSRCPVCQTEIEMAASTNLEPAKTNHNFFGQRGNRSIICSEGAHFHFVIAPDSPSPTHRYAFLINRSTALFMTAGAKTPLGRAARKNGGLLTLNLNQVASYG